MITNDKIQNELDRCARSIISKIPSCTRHIYTHDGFTLPSTNIFFRIQIGLITFTSLSFLIPSNSISKALNHQTANCKLIRIASCVLRSSWSIFDFCDYRLFVYLSILCYQFDTLKIHRVTNPPLKSAKYGWLHTVNNLFIFQKWIYSIKNLLIL